MYPVPVEIFLSADGYASEQEDYRFYSNELNTFFNNRFNLMTRTCVLYAEYNASLSSSLVTMQMKYNV